MSEEYSSDNLYEQFAQVMNQTQDLVDKMKQLQAKIIAKSSHIIVKINYLDHGKI